MASRAPTAYLLAFVLAFVALGATAQNIPNPTDLKAQLAQTLASTPVPGAAVAVVHNGQTVLTEGFGIRRVGQPLPVDAQTRFKLASITKSFTGLAAALLVGEGKLKLEDPVKRWLPELRLASKTHERGLTIEDLLSHRSGLDLPALDALFWPQPNQFTIKDLMRALVTIKTTAPVRSRFEYSNAAYVLTGEVIARVSGKPYHRFVQERILVPLGMGGCSFGGLRADASANLAQPHRLLASGAEPVRTDEGPYTDWPVGLEAAAGGLRCDAQSLAQWVMLFADPDGAANKTFADAVRLVAAPRAWVGSAAPHDQQARYQSAGYGLGMESVADNGAAKLFHFGGVAGISAYMAVYPKQRSGYVVAINGQSMAHRDALSATVERALGVNTLTPLTAAAASPVIPTAAPPPVATALEPKAWRALAGVYRNNWWGPVSLCAVGGVPTATVHASPRLVADVRSGTNGQAQLLWRDVMVDSDAEVTPVQSRNAQVMGFSLKPVTESDFDFSYMRFVRVSACPPSSH